MKIWTRIITKNHAADSKIGSPQKIDFRAVETHESNPKAWELSLNFEFEALIVQSDYLDVILRAQLSVICGLMWSTDRSSQVFIIMS